MWERPDLGRRFSLSVHTDGKVGALFSALAIELKGDVYPSKNWPFAFSPQGETTPVLKEKEESW